MPKVSIYLPDDLYEEVRRHGLPLSALTQRAAEQALSTTARHAWIARMRARESSSGDLSGLDTAAIMAEVREELGQ